MKSLEVSGAVRLIYGSLGVKRLSDIFGAFTKLRKWLLSSSYFFVCPHRTTRFPIDEFPWNLIVKYFFENLSRKCTLDSNSISITGILNEDISTFVTISHWILLKIRTFSNVLENNKKHILWSSPQLYRLWKCGKIWYSQAGQRWQYTRNMRFAPWLTKATNTHS